ncbi:hypothetical protein ACNTMW_34100 [Planosporangium sp. 12N6]|uniref:hypothetical protein n=1 Tax=Planosporangium spinosum TaxID=3402278 RepID=UPI003CE743E7
MVAPAAGRPDQQTTSAPGNVTTMTAIGYDAPRRRGDDDAPDSIEGFALPGADLTPDEPP